MTLNKTDGVTITPGAMTLADWRRVYDGASATLNTDAWAAGAYTNPL